MGGSGQVLGEGRDVCVCVTRSSHRAKSARRRRARPFIFFLAD